VVSIVVLVEETPELLGARRGTSFGHFADYTRIPRRAGRAAPWGERVLVSAGNQTVGRAIRPL
jgi:hypothetical protein